MLAVALSKRSEASPQLPPPEELPPELPPVPEPGELEQMSTPELLAMVGDIQTFLSGSNSLETMLSDIDNLDAGAFQNTVIGLSESLASDYALVAFDTMMDAANIIVDRHAREKFESPGLPTSAENTANDSEAKTYVESLFGEDGSKMIQDAIAANDAGTIENYIKAAYAKYEQGDANAALVYSYLYDQYKLMGGSNGGS